MGGIRRYELKSNYCAVYGTFEIKADEIELFIKACQGKSGVSKQQTASYVLTSQLKLIFVVFG